MYPANISCIKKIGRISWREILKSAGNGLMYPPILKKKIKKEPDHAIQ